MDVNHDIALVAARAGKVLQALGLLITTAESCTGGGIAQALTEIPGSSQWFDCGFVTYSNASKTSLLNVPETLIALHGAVSEEVAAAMATGALARAHAQVAVSVSGIAGPGGAVPGKPVGTVCFAYAARQLVHTETHHFSGDRHAIRTQAVIHALNRVLAFLEPA